MSKRYEICEGVESYYRYHYREPGSYRSLCGRHVMYAHPSIRWGQPNADHLPSAKYCDECRKKADES